ncbi:cytosolic phospholipase A2-like [Actinia tenebrosa]|uniref:Phospholipase A2 n=1 Tax=Actinia tenebrosa TaxID=6105 RepID=A0A6P8IKW3_ACTTE|nr:cytosolic phospholipase A2-like [Actinia tenebrosa]XP_031567433.1 cytosolic phospholipase A2-like [Actinia tenebrosa]XP_031567434.1 cytosolic phospholipase A2-like [Actinia tenebrosa]
MSAFQASYRPCLEFQITVLRGRDISKGKVADYIDTPDPYVRIRIPTAPSGKAATKVVCNNKNPEWHETFKFLLDPNKENTMEITLMESDIVSDDVLDTHTFRINDLEVDTTCKQTFKFGETSKVDVEMKLTRCPFSDELRFSGELCSEEKQFLAKRRQIVFEAMQEILGEQGPSNINEVPTVAILGSGGGFRAMTSLSGVMCALKDTRILDCATYIAGLSGSAWYISCLYSHPDWPSVHPRVVLEELRENVKENLIWLLLQPKWVYKHMQLISKKKKNGQPVSFTDIFGYLVGDTIRKGREPPKLSHQKEKVEDGFVPLPLYTCVNVKKDVSAHAFCEWLEFSPYEAGFPKYGTFMSTELFGSKFYCGRVLKKFEEPDLRYLQGIWGSAFTILLQQVVREGLKEPEEVIMAAENKGNLRKQMEDMVASDAIGHANKANGEESDEESNDEPKESPNKAEKDKEDAPEQNGEEHKSDADKFADIVDKVINKFEIFRTRQGRAGLVHNFLRGIDLKLSDDRTDNPDKLELVTEDKRIFLVDSGMVLNSPYPILLRPERSVDLYLSFDFSARDKDDEEPFKELLLAEEWAKKNNYPFPPINAAEQIEKEGLKECYIFRHPTDKSCPIVIHFALINKAFMEYSKPGVPRTEEEKLAAKFSIFEDPKKHYSTFNFHYPNDAFDRLSQLTEFNTLICEQTIKDVMAECVQRKKPAAVAKNVTPAKPKKEKKDKCILS